MNEDAKTSIGRQPTTISDDELDRVSGAGNKPASFFNGVTSRFSSSARPVMSPDVPGIIDSAG